MSGAIGNLVRLHRWTLDEKRRAVTDLERLAERMRADIDALDAEIAAERAVAAGSLDGAVAYPAFVAVARKRREKLAASLSAIEQETEQAREAVQAAFEELKKYELAEANAARRLAAKRQRAERLAEDELGLDLHRRKGG